MKLYKIIFSNRMKNSLSGNPRYSFTLQDHETKEFIQCSTRPDYGFAYGVLNNAPWIMAKIITTPAKRCYMVNAETGPIEKPKGE